MNKTRMVRDKEYINNNFEFRTIRKKYYKNEKVNYLYLMYLAEWSSHA